MSRTSLAGSASARAVPGAARTAARTMVSMTASTVASALIGSRLEPGSEPVARVGRYVAADFEHDLGVARERDRAGRPAPPSAVQKGADGTMEAGDAAGAERLAPDREQLLKGSRCACVEDHDPGGLVGPERVGAGATEDVRAGAPLGRRDPDPGRDRHD